MRREQRIHERQRSARIHALGGYDKETFFKAAASSAEYLNQCMSLEKERDAYKTRYKEAEGKLMAVLRANSRTLRAQVVFRCWDTIPSFEEAKRGLKHRILEKAEEEIKYMSVEQHGEVVYTAELRLAAKEGGSQL